MTLSRPELDRLAASPPARVVRVRVAKVLGSAPREEGAEMFVTEADAFGTIGGGQLEYMAIDEARALLARNEAAGAMDVPLGPAIGQCCGGRVGLALTRIGPAALADALAAARAALDRAPPVLVFGAGHVGRALVRALLPLPVNPVLIDSRPAELARAGTVPVRLTPLPEAEVRAAPPGSAYVIVTHDHALDFLIADEALARGDAAYVGMIGSASKAATYARRARTVPGWAGDLSALACPMAPGAKHDKRPEVIAAFIAAEVMARLAVRVSA